MLLSVSSAAITARVHLSLPVLALVSIGNKKGGPGGVALAQSVYASPVSGRRPLGEGERVALRERTLRAGRRADTHDGCVAAGGVDGGVIHSSAPPRTGDGCETSGSTCTVQGSRVISCEQTQRRRPSFVAARSPGRRCGIPHMGARPLARPGALTRAAVAGRQSRTCRGDAPATGPGPDRRGRRQRRAPEHDYSASRLSARDRRPASSVARGLAPPLAESHLQEG